VGLAGVDDRHHTILSTPIRLVIVDRFIQDAGGNVVGICSVFSESALSGA